MAEKVGNLVRVCLARRVSDEPQPASPEQLASELAAMMRTGVTVKGCRSAPGLSGLTITRAKAASTAPDDLAVAASNLVREACARVDDIGEGNTAILLGVASGWRGTLPKHRRQEVADNLCLTVDHVRDYREPPLLQAVADEIYAMDSAYRLRHRHRTEIERNPTASRLGIDWLEQHRSYRRIWSPVTALRADTLTLAAYLQDAGEAGKLPRTQANLEEHGPDHPSLLAGDEWHAISDRCMNLCWRLAQFTWDLDRFVEREGGLWLLADAEAELQAADAMYRLNLHLPFGETDESVLRLFLTAAQDHELDPFDEALITDARWPVFRDVWIDWVQDYVGTDAPRSSRPGAEHPLSRQKDSGPSGIVRVTDGTEQSECGLWLHAGEDFIQLIDEDWYRVADWYRTRS